MKTRLRYLWDQIRNSYWFMPTLLAAGAISAAFLVLGLDARLGLEVIREAGWLAELVYTGGPEGARSVLSTIAGSMITVAGVTFSITIVALTLASAQFGPRVLTNFMSDRGSQFVLGTFIATFLYCLVVLRTIRTGLGDGPAVVPHIAVTIAVGLAVASLGVLIYFIHHVAVTIQAPNIIASIARELDGSIDDLFPPRPEGARGPSPPPGSAPPLEAGAGARVHALASGYVDAVDLDGLLELARERGLLLRLEYRPGLFVAPGATLARAWPARAMDEALERAVRDAHVLSPRRSTLQDAEFSIDQLVEVAVRALSPGINDPFTAINCIDHLTALACRVVGRDMPPSTRRDEAGEPRLVLDRPLTRAGLLDAAFHQIRQNAAHHVAVHLRLLEGLARVAGCTGDSRWLTPLRRHAELVLRGGLSHVRDPADQEEVRERYRWFLEAAAG